MMGWHAAADSSARGRIRDIASVGPNTAKRHRLRQTDWDLTG